jgi:hypothetical protein
MGNNRCQVGSYRYYRVRPNEIPGDTTNEMYWWRDFQLQLGSAIASLRLLSDTIPEHPSPGFSIPLARLALCGHLARRPGRRARRHAHAQGDRAAPLRPPHTQEMFAYETLDIAN